MLTWCVFLHQIVSLDLRNRWWRFFPLPSLHKDKHYRNNTIILMLQMAVVVSHFCDQVAGICGAGQQHGWGQNFRPNVNFFLQNATFFSQGRFFGDAELTIFLKGSSLRGKDPTIYKFRIWTILRVVLCPFIPAKTDYLNLSQRQYQNHIGQVPPRAAWRCLLRPRLTNLDGLVHQVHHLRHVVDHDDHCHQVLLSISRSLQQRVRGPWGERGRGGAVGEDHRLPSLREVPYSF